MYKPISTYRIQFNKNFTFKDLLRTIPYLIKLGIKTIYASPIFKAVSGSQHGYDSVSFEEINPEIGTEEELLRIVSELKRNDIGWIQDIVPNHMAFHPENSYLMDVMEHGTESEYFYMFDFFQDVKHDEKLMVPFLGLELNDALKNEDINLEVRNNKIYLVYGSQQYPVSPRSYGLILEKHINLTESDYTDWEITRHQLFQKFEGYIQDSIDEINKSRSLFEEILSLQNYILCYWRETEHHINYRRFFTINSLIGLRMEDVKVFKRFHQKIIEFTKRGIFQGLRIDHIDGLFNPTEYLNRLRFAVGGDVYISVEKILDKDELIPSNWPIQGNTGYDFLAMSNKLFSQSKNYNKFAKLYKKYSDKDFSYQDILYQCKSQILYKHMQGELDNLYKLFCDAQHTITKESAQHIKTAIGEILINCPVYRYYSGSTSLSKDTLSQINHVCDLVSTKRADLKDAVQAIADVFNAINQKRNSNSIKALHFYRRCMQFTGPLMAKGNEDTLMYVFNEMLGHNEVGDTAETFSMSAKNFHHKMSERALDYPLSQNATSTHDTKRGEDVRARLNVLTEMFSEWHQLVKVWDKQTTHINVSGNDKYHIYQMVIGTYPMQESDEQYRDRLIAYSVKALREGKVNSSWAEPNEIYEGMVADLIDLLLDKNEKSWGLFQALQTSITDHGIVNSLAQVVLKLTCPGLPDIYQGTELWDLSMVDPDNRRPVDYDLRKRLLEELNGQTLAQLWKERHNGKIKLWLTHTLQSHLNSSAETFSDGLYFPLKVKGKYKDHVVAYARHSADKWHIMAIPLNSTTVAKEQKRQIAELNWEDTAIVLPNSISRRYYNVLTRNYSEHNGHLLVNDVFRPVPIALIQTDDKHITREAGILVSVTSLPSKFGIGNIGNSAKKFVDFLFNSRQRVWQLLPLTPIDADNKYSPYSSISSMAGNILLIDPEYLVKQELLTTEEIVDLQFGETDQVNYAVVEKKLYETLAISFERFKANNANDYGYEQFCDKEAYWLHDFALFTILSKAYLTAWHQWPEEYKTRKEHALNEFWDKHHSELEFIKWTQYLFHQQWKETKRYCSAHNIKILGDLPFYVSHNSAEVWAHPDLFCLDAHLNVSGVAGVPPDYFSKDGQLWGMPTFNWNKMKSENYTWWITRLKKNLQMADILRLDHFRAFAAYWQVPAGELTAVNGEWLKGPGKDFFDTVKKELGTVPFVAEDLGYEMDDVYLLRDEIELPGMKVLQFAFGENMPESVDIPHNHIVNSICYTGTHDNNTAIGWFNEETTKQDRKRLKDYTGVKPSEKNISNLLSQLAYGSVSKTAILPIQDILALDANARMNTPGTADNNWKWHLTSNQLNSKVSDNLRNFVKMYNRG